jgi:hypothetical protein
VKTCAKKKFKKILQSVAFFRKKLIFVLATLFPNDHQQPNLCTRTLLPYEKEKALHCRSSAAVSCADSGVPLGTATPDSSVKIDQ